MASVNRLYCAAAFVIALASAAIAQPAGDPLAEGIQLRAQGRYAEAQKTLSSLCRELEAAAPGTPYLASVLDNLAQTEMDLGRLVESESLMTRSLSLWRRTAGPSSSGAIAAETHLAELYSSERRNADAEPLLREAIASMEEMAQPDRIALAVARCDLALVRSASGHHEEAETLLQGAVQLYEAELGKDHPILTGALLPLAAIRVNAHRYAEAVEPVERAWQILRAAGPQIASQDLAAALDMMAVVYSHTGRLPEAESSAKEAIRLAGLVYAPDDRHLGWYLANYAGILKQAHRGSEAKQIAKRSRAILTEIDADNPGRFTVTANSLRQDSAGRRPIP